MESKNVKIDNEDKFIESVRNSIDQKLVKLSPNPSKNLDAACIFKVSQKLRKANEAAYTPRLVSIGPLHHDLGQVQGMETYKLRFLNNFMTRFGIGLNTLVKFAAQKQSFVRGCYEGTINLSKKLLTEMILLDGIFIVELFLENHFFQLRDRKEIIFENHWMYKDLLHDMLLLENQLPISIMNDLLNFVDFSFLNEGVKFTIYGLAHKFFKDVGITQKIPLTERCCEARHFVDFLLILHAPPQQEPRKYTRSATGRCCEARHFVECLGILRAPGKPRKSASKKFEYTRSATELHEAGVKFRDAYGNCFFDVLFDNGVLTIPKLNVNDTTETFFRNLIAYEQCGYRGYYSEDITSYVILMDSLINTSSDVDLLVKSKIIENNLGSSELVAHLFNNLYKDVVTEANIFYFDKLCEELNKYSRDELHKWKARCFNWRVMLGRDYFSNPWSGLSVLAAVLLLILTVIQTVCSILQVQ